MVQGRVELIMPTNAAIVLTTNPEITFFKAIYKKHTNFAIETISQSFQDFNFGQTSQLVLEPQGDLVNRMFLRIGLPEIRPRLRDTFNDNSNPDNNPQANQLSRFVELNCVLIRKANQFLKIPQITLRKILDQLNSTAESREMDQIRNELSEDDLSSVKLVDIRSIIRHTMVSVQLENQVQWLNRLIQDQLYKQLQDLLKSNAPILESNQDQIRWRQYLGHKMIESIQIQIGALTLDTQSGDFLNSFYELSMNVNQSNAYNKLIGNIPELYNWSETKPSYTLNVPLQFWFNRFIGRSLPVTAIKQDIMIELKIRDLMDLIELQSNVDLTRVDLTECSLLTDYIYLDTEERNRFINETNEYLINQVQEVTLTGSIIHIDLSNPCSFVMWHSLDHEEFGTVFKINYYKLNDIHEPMYYQILQPYWYFNHIPNPELNLNVYSFSLNPLDSQPSGSVNLTEIKDMSLEFDQVHEIKFYAYTYAVLSISNGAAQLLF